MKHKAIVEFTWKSMPMRAAIQYSPGCPEMAPSLNSPGEPAEGSEIEIDVLTYTPDNGPETDASFLLEGDFQDELYEFVGEVADSHYQDNRNNYYED